MAHVTVLGAGLWGTTLAHRVAQGGRTVALWDFSPESARRLEQRRTQPNIPGLVLHKKVRATSALEEALRGADTLIVAVPSEHLRHTAMRVRRALSPKQAPHAVLSASKGFEAGTLKTMCEALEEEFKGLGMAVFALSGPSFAREVAAGVPTGLVLAGNGHLPSPELCALLRGPTIRILPSRDRKGTELGGALKNVMAIGCGIADGLGYGANTKALLMTEALREMETIALRAGAESDTLRGPAGLGDLIATGTSPLSRNRTLGEHLGGGEGLERALRAVRTVAEGVESAQGAWELSRALNVDAPVLSAVRAIVVLKRSPRILLKALGF